MKRFFAAAVVALAFCAAPALALADDMAYTTSGVNMRAGPDREYPRVAYIPAASRSKSSAASRTGPGAT
jgi:uncharacterized protein YraI